MCVSGAHRKAMSRCVNEFLLLINLFEFEKVLYRGSYNI